MKEHIYQNLPLRGMARGFSGVEIGDSVIIQASLVSNDDFWPIVEQRILERAKELNADICWQELPTQKASGSTKFKLWFKEKP